MTVDDLFCLGLRGFSEFGIHHQNLLLFLELVVVALMLGKLRLEGGNVLETYSVLGSLLLRHLRLLLCRLEALRLLWGRFYGGGDLFLIFLSFLQELLLHLMGEYILTLHI